MAGGRSGNWSCHRWQNSATIKSVVNKKTTWFGQTDQLILMPSRSEGES